MHDNNFILSFCFAFVHGYINFLSFWNRWTWTEKYTPFKISKEKFKNEFYDAGGKSGANLEGLLITMFRFPANSKHIFAKLLKFYFHAIMFIIFVHFELNDRCGNEMFNPERLFPNVHVSHWTGLLTSSDVEQQRRRGLSSSLVFGVHFAVWKTTTVLCAKDDDGAVVKYNNLLFPNEVGWSVYISIICIIKIEVSMQLCWRLVGGWWEGGVDLNCGKNIHRHHDFQSHHLVYLLASCDIAVSL